MTGTYEFPIIILSVLILITANTSCDANYKMTSHTNVEQEEPTTGLPTVDSEFDVEEDADSDLDEDAHSDVDLEEEMKKWLSTAYERGSKKPMKEPLTAPWGLLVSDADMERIKVGFKSQSMDDKWDLLVEDPDMNGNISLHILRNWLQEECYVLHIVPKPSNDDGGSAMIQSITWEGNKVAMRRRAGQEGSCDCVQMLAPLRV